MLPINRRIVITSIFAPGEARRRFAALPDWPLAIVADRKTPPVSQLAGARFLSVEEQGDLPFRILPAHVNFRVTDILRRYVAQPIMRAGATVGDNLHRVYTQRVGKGFVGAEEMTLVDAWLEDVTALS